MKFFIHLIFFELIIANLFAQNLVPNPSFEDTVACPTTLSQIDHAVGWMSFKESSDYYNSCADAYWLGIPNNAAGFQEAADGKAYAGIVMSGNPIASGNNGREYFGTQLNQSLSIGIKYYVSLKVVLSDVPGRDCAINNLGAKFTTYYLDAPDDNYPSVLITNSAQVYSQSILDDSINWLTISGSFIADSAYSYIVIGNFFDDDHTDTLHCLSTAYYYVDQVCVSADSLICFTKQDLVDEVKKNHIKIFPNPTDRDFHIELGSIGMRSAEIRNTLGISLQKINTIGKMSITFNISSYPAGVYFVVVHDSEKDFVEKVIKK